MKKQPKIIIICVESSKQAGIDDKYISTIIKYYYGNNLPIRFVNMEGKGNYDKKAVKQAIDAYAIGFKQAIVIYVIDLDNVELNMTQANLNNSIQVYCIQKDYQLIWFYPNIEFVLLNKDIDKSQKRQMVTQFVNNGGIELIDSSYLEASSPKRGYSNILNVLDDHLTRKR